MESLKGNIGAETQNNPSFLEVVKEKIVDPLGGYSNLYAKAMIQGWAKKKDHAGVLKIVEEEYTQYRPETVIEGEENLPKEGGFIIVPNHFARVDNKENMEGKLKMTDMLLTMAMVNKVIRENTSAKRILWPEALTPRPSKPRPEEVKLVTFARWVINEAKFASANALREVYFKAFSYAQDIVAVPHKFEPTKINEISVKTEATLNDGGVLAIFPEGEVTHALNAGAETERDKAVRFNGAAHYAMKHRKTIVPVATWDDKGTLRMVIGKPIAPPDNRFEKKDVMEEVFMTIAKILPEDLRGEYYGPKVVQLQATETA